MPDAEGYPTLEDAKDWYEKAYSHWEGMQPDPSVQMYTQFATAAATIAHARASQPASLTVDALRPLSPEEMDRERARWRAQYGGDRANG